MNENGLQDLFFENVQNEASNLKDIISSPARSIERFMVNLDVPGDVLIKNAPFHNEAHEFITNNLLSVIVVPRDHGKTEQFAIGRPLWEIAQNLNIRGKLFSEALELGKTRLLSIKEHIEKNKRYQELFPHVKPSKQLWQSERITVERDTHSKDSTMAALGAYTAITGERADLIVCDDICGMTSMLYPTERLKVKEIFKNNIMNILSPAGRLIYIATPWHFDDLTMELMNGSPGNGFAVYFRAIDRELTPLWMDKYDTEALEKKRNEITEGPFTRGFHCEPLAGEEAIFDRDAIRACIRVGKIDIEGVDNSWLKVLAIDPAISKQSWSDFTCLFALSIRPSDRMRIPLEIVRKKLSATETANEIIRMNHYHHFDVIIVENAGYQTALREVVDIVSKEKLPIETPPTTQQKHTRANILSVQIKNKNWIIYNHQDPLSSNSESCNCGTCMFVVEMANCPASKHDDTWDAASLADIGANRLLASSPIKGNIKFKKLQF